MNQLDPPRQRAVAEVASGSSRVIAATETFTETRTPSFCNPHSPKRLEMNQRAELDETTDSLLGKWQACLGFQGEFAVTRRYSSELGTYFTDSFTDSQRNRFFAVSSMPHHRAVRFGGEKSKDSGSCEGCRSVRFSILV